ncbi:SIP1 domain-containing protein [Ceratobasidium sp. AG-Ba]|nr:SIP1 domain-containing protein [Ceratobasidium sp. AG-Ba]QRW01933.1 SIP1 domain-containing protein [Ceratobasidium sp. AG-Ba]
MPPKRKSGSLDDDEEPTPGNRVLPVANLPDDFNKEPEDGAQYLFLVRRDALSLPHTTRADNPYAAPIVSSIPSARKPPHPCIPSEEWRTSFEETFKAFRQSWRSNRANQPEESSTRTPQTPRPRDRDGWLQFINGVSKSPKKSQELQYPPSTAFTPRSVLTAKFAVPMTPTPTPPAQLNPSPPRNIQTAGIIDDEPPVSVKEEPDEEPLSSEPQKPIPSIIRKMDDAGVIYLLMFISHWIRKSLENISSTTPPNPLTRPFYFPRHHQQWAFALLAQLDTSLRSEEISHLRELARACIDAIKEDLEFDGPAFVPPTLEDSITAKYTHLIGTWMIVGAVASVWGQRDMWEHAEDVLSCLVVVKPRVLEPPAPLKASGSVSAVRPAPYRPDSDFDVVLNYG